MKSTRTTTEKAIVRESGREGGIGILFLFGIFMYGAVILLWFT